MREIPENEFQGRYSQNRQHELHKNETGRKRKNEISSGFLLT